MPATYTIPDFGPADILTNSTEFKRRLKTASEPSIAASIRHGMVYAVTGSYSLLAGQQLGFNLSLAAESIIHKVTTNTGLTVYLRDQHATGTSDGIFAPVNLSACSVDVSPSSAQLFYAATAQGGIMSVGETSIEPYAIADASCDVSAVVLNDTGATKNVFISILFEEISSRLSNFGLTASTLLEPSTEMSVYG